MANKILVFIEQRNGQIKKSSLEAAKAASDLASKLGYSAEGIAIGNDIQNLDSVGGYGLTKVTHFKNGAVENYSTSAYTEITSNFAKEIDADILFFPNSSLGKDLAPHVSAKLDCGIATDIIAIDNNNGELVATRPVYAGKALVDVKVTSSKKVYTLRPNVFNPGTPADAKAEIST